MDTLLLFEDFLELALDPQKKYCFTIRKIKKKPVSGYKLTGFTLQKYFRLEHKCKVLFRDMEILIQKVYNHWKTMMDSDAKQIQAILRVNDQFVYNMQDLVISLKKNFASKPDWRDLLETVKKEIEPQTEQ